MWKSRSTFSHTFYFLFTFFYDYFIILLFLCYFFIIIIFWSKQKYVFDFQHYSFIAIIRKISLPSTQTGNSFVYAFHHCSGRMSCVLLLFFFFVKSFFLTCKFSFRFSKFHWTVISLQNIRSYKYQSPKAGIALRFYTIYICCNVIELEIKVYLHLFLLCFYIFWITYIVFFSYYLLCFPHPILEFCNFQLICTPNFVCF